MMTCGTMQAARQASVHTVSSCLLGSALEILVPKTSCGP